MTPEEFLQKTTYSWTTEEYNEALADAMKMGEGEWSKKWGPRIQINPKLSSDWIESDLQKKQSLEYRLKAEFGDSFDVDENWKNQVWQSKFSDVPKEQYEAALNKLWGEELDKGIQLGDEEQENIRKSKEYDRLLSFYQVQLIDIILQIIQKLIPYLELKMILNYFVKLR